MAENIFAGLMGLAVIAAGIWGWKMEHGGSKEKDKQEQKEVRSQDMKRRVFPSFFFGILL